MSNVFHFDHMPKAAKQLDERINKLTDELRGECARVDKTLQDNGAQPNDIERATIVTDDVKKLGDIAASALLTAAVHPNMMTNVTRCDDYAARMQDAWSSSDMPDPQVVADEALKENGLLD